MMQVPGQRKPLDASILLLQREGIISNAGKKVPADPHPIECLVLNGTNGRKFGMRITSQDHPQSKDALLDNSKVVYVDMNDCRERLLLDQDEQIEGELETYLQKKSLPSVLKNYERLQAKNKAFDTSLLIRMVKAAFEYRSSSKTRGVNLSGCEKLKASIVGKSILAGFREDKLTLVDMTDKKVLWKGGESVVYTARALPHGREVIAKVYFRDMGSINPHTEALFLEHLHETCSAPSEKCVPGIQRPYLGLVETDADAYILQSKYQNGNLDDILKVVASAFPTMDSKLLAFYRLLSALHICFTKAGFVHRDIKPLNILVRIDKATGKPLLDLADFGAALLCDPAKVESPKPKGATPGFILLGDLTMRADLEQALSKNADRAVWIRYIELAHKGDIFALGRVFAIFLVPGKEVDEHFWNPEPNSLKQEVLLDAGVPREICRLIRKMMEPELTKRFNSSAALKVLESILIKRGLLLSTQAVFNSSLSAQEGDELLGRDKSPSPERSVSQRIAQNIAQFEAMLRDQKEAAVELSVPSDLREWG